MITTSQAASMIYGELLGEPDIIIHCASKIEEGTDGSISFLANPKYEEFIYTTKASAVIVDRTFIPQKNYSTCLIKVDSVYMALNTLLHFFYKDVTQLDGISGVASISDKAALQSHVGVGDFVVISEGCKVGQRSQLFPHVYLGRNVEIGEDCIIYPGVKIYHSCKIGDRAIIHANAVIGSDGFGFTPNQNGQFEKMMQVGNVVLEDDVEIGANTVIDRGSMGDTIIRKGVKLDNLIQIAHNVEIGKNTIIAAQAGIAGSTKLGQYCVIGGQVGLAGHIEIKDKTMIQAKSGLSSSTKTEGQKLYGYPAIDYTAYLKSYSVFKNLPELSKKINELESELKKLKNNEG